MCQFSSRPRNWATHPPRWEVDILVQLVPCKIYLYTQVLDSRREDLEKYLQYLAKIEPLPFELSEFLNLEDLTTSSDSAGCSKNARPFKKYFFSHYLLFYFIYFFLNITFTGDFETPVVSVVLDYEELDSFGDIITNTTVDTFYSM